MHNQPPAQLGQRSDFPITVDAFLHECVAITPEALDEECVRVSADLAYWNERYAVAHKAHLMAKLDLERTEARLSIEHREMMASADGKKGPTVDAVRAAVVNDAQYVEAQLAVINAEVERARLRGLSYAVESKKDMLQSIGAKERVLMNDPMVRASRAPGSF